MKKKSLEELKVLADKAKKSLEEDLKSNREQQEHLSCHLRTIIKKIRLHDSCHLTPP